MLGKDGYIKHSNGVAVIIGAIFCFEGIPFSIQVHAELM